MTDKYWKRFVRKTPQCCILHFPFSQWGSLWTSHHAAKPLMGEAFRATLIVKFIKLASKARLNYVGKWTEGRGGPVDSLNSAATFSLTQWRQNYTTMQGWPFNCIGYCKPDFYSHTDPCSHTKPFDYSETAQGSACAVFTVGSGPKFLCICLMQGNWPGVRWSHVGHGVHLPVPLLCFRKERGIARAQAGGAALDVPTWPRNAGSKLT